MVLGDHRRPGRFKGDGVVHRVVDRLGSYRGDERLAGGVRSADVGTGSWQWTGSKIVPVPACMGAAHEVMSAPKVV